MSSKKSARSSCICGRWEFPFETGKTAAGQSWGNILSDSIWRLAILHSRPPRRPPRTICKSETQTIDLIAFLFELLEHICFPFLVVNPDHFFGPWTSIGFVKFPVAAEIGHRICDRIL